jgi:hypothetical protein
MPIRKSLKTVYRPPRVIKHVFAPYQKGLTLNLYAPLTLTTQIVLDRPLSVLFWIVLNG